MLPDKEGRVRVRASFAGWVEFRVQPGDVLLRGGAIAVVEGDVEMETLCARSASRVLSLEVDDDSEVDKDTVIAVIQEMDEDQAVAEAQVQHRR
ncbi:MAG: hypothetical protein H6742_08420 [Alphaproteobacteria bacterium]|nr:hypothetical protein [Alphaproteobacteria bacterium]